MKHKTGWPWLTALLIFLLYFIIREAVSLLWEYLLIVLVPDHPDLANIYQIGRIFVTVLIALPAYLLICRKKYPQNNPLAAGQMLKGWDMVKAFCLLQAGSLIPMLIMISIAYVSGGKMGLQEQAGVVDIIWLVLLTPVIEEIINRGCLFRQLSYLGEWRAIWISTLAFSLGHGNLINGILALLPGIILCKIAVKTKGIGSGIVLHMVTNLISGVIVPYIIYN